MVDDSETASEMYGSDLTFATNTTENRVGAAVTGV